MVFLVFCATYSLDSNVCCPFDISCAKDLEVGGFGSCVNTENNPLFKEKREQRINI